MLVAVFQWGWASSALGVSEKIPVESYVPMMMGVPVVPAVHERRGEDAGLGLGVSVLIDATVIRLIVVPATMFLLGRYN